MRIKKPRQASLDEVRITRAGDTAVIENTDPSVSVVRLAVGPALSSMNDAAVLDLFNGVIEAQHKSSLEYDDTLVEIPPGRPHSRFEAAEFPRIRETAILITARMCDSRFEWAAHEPEAVSAGVPTKVIDVIKHIRRVAGLDDTDQIIITLGREAIGKRKVSSKTYARALKRFGARGLIDLVALMGNYASTAILLTVFGMRRDDDKDVARLPVG